MPNLFFASDHHFGQSSMLKFLRSDGQRLRSFDSVEEMNETMIERHNSVVRPQDKYYFGGDVAMKKEDLSLLKRLNGHGRLIFGNHDIHGIKAYLEYFEEVYGVRVLSDMILSHIPLHPSSITKRYSCCTHGHLHANEVTDEMGNPDGRYFNVCVEQLNYTPISLEDLRIEIKKKQEKYPPVYPEYTKQAD